MEQITKRSYHRFTKEENNIIIESVTASNTIKEGIMIAASKLNLPKEKIFYHFYKDSTFDSIKYTKRKQRTQNYNNVKRVVKKEIKNNPTNLQQAFREASKVTGLASKTISKEYYTKNSYLHKSNIGVCLTLISGKKVVYNGKNSDTQQPKVQVSKTNKLFNLFKILFK